MTPNFQGSANAIAAVMNITNAKTNGNAVPKKNDLFV
jgi:hypothetical protein